MSIKASSELPSATVTLTANIDKATKGASALPLVSDSISSAPLDIELKFAARERESKSRPPVHDVADDSDEDVPEIEEAPPKRVAAVTDKPSSAAPSKTEKAEKAEASKTEASTTAAKTEAKTETKDAAKEKKSSFSFSACMKGFFVDALWGGVVAVAKAVYNCFAGIVKALMCCGKKEKADDASENKQLQAEARDVKTVMEHPELTFVRGYISGVHPKVAEGIREQMFKARLEEAKAKAGKDKDGKDKPVDDKKIREEVEDAWNFRGEKLDVNDNVHDIRRAADAYVASLEPKKEESKEATKAATKA